MYGHGVIYEGTYLNININSDIKRDEITAAYEKEQREKEQREKEQRRRNSKKSRNEGYIEENYDIAINKYNNTC